MGVLIPGTTSWPEAIPAFVVAALLLFLPGLVAAFILRLSLLGSLVVAPFISTTILAVGGIIADWVGVRWGYASLLGACVMAWLLTAGMRVGSEWVGNRRRDVSARVMRADMPGKLAWRSALHAELRGPLLWTAIAGLVAAFVVFCVSAIPEMGTPEAIPQHPDTIFHLGAAQWTLESGSISSLTIGGFSSSGWSGFYPAAFHGFTASISLFTGASVVVATEAFVLVVAGVVWPLGCIGLGLTLLGGRPHVALISAIMSVAFTGFPYFLMGFGVLWPNLFGQALLPAALAAFCALRGSWARPSFTVAPRPTALWLVLIALPALLLAHPNALMSFGLFAALILIGWAFGFAYRRRRESPRTALLLPAAIIAALSAILVGVTRMRPASMVRTGAYGPEASADYAWESLLHFAPRHTLQLTQLAVITGVGVIALLVRHRGARWVVPALFIMLGLFWLNVAVDTTWVRYLTWPWYNNAVRLQAVAIVPAVIAASAGFLAIADVLTRPLTRRSSWSIGVTAALLVAFAVSTAGLYVNAHQHILHRYFHPKPADSWVSNAELRSLRALSQHLPEDAVVAANPWNGATYLYVVSGRHLLIPTEKANFPGDRTLLASTLDRVGTDPSVCAAAERQRVDWAITGGEPFSWARTRVKQYAGIDSVGSSPAWRQVAAASPYTLYKRVSCAR
ncbi:DUF6541 family protein [Intrasporangium sp.]|uniref:DUF6541 family protein n=1 Tax=Intrasporangium sp. TaxID=1925024 RepID=UPI003365955C